MQSFDTDLKKTIQQSSGDNTCSKMAPTLLDLCTALFFLFGSVCFFFDSLFVVATWFFVFGSLLMAVKPTLRLVREIKLLSLRRESAQADAQDD